MQSIQIYIYLYMYIYIYVYIYIYIYIYILYIYVYIKYLVLSEKAFSTYLFPGLPSQSSFVQGHFKCSFKSMQSSFENHNMTIEYDILKQI